MSEKLPIVQPEHVSDVIEAVALVRTYGEVPGGQASVMVYIDSHAMGSAEAQARQTLAGSSGGYSEYALITIPIPRSLLKPMHRSQT